MNEFDVFGIPEGQKKSDVGGTPEGGKAQTEQNIEARLGKLQEDQQKIAGLAQLLQDPDVMRVLEAKKKGEKISVQANSNEPSIQTQEVKDWEEMSNTELVKNLVTEIGGLVGKIVDERLSPVTNQVDKVNKFVDHNLRREAQTQIQATAAKYADFNDFRQPMLELNNNPTLSVEELYLISKLRTLKTNGALEGKASSSERPSSSSTRVSEETNVNTRGQGGFRAALRANLEKSDLSEFGD